MLLRGLLLSDLLLAELLLMKLLLTMLLLAMMLLVRLLLMELLLGRLLGLLLLLRQLLLLLPLGISTHVGCQSLLNHQAGGEFTYSCISIAALGLISAAFPARLTAVVIVGGSILELL
jgi:hypothetical protein